MGQPSATYDNICDRKRAATWIFPPLPSLLVKREKQPSAQGRAQADAVGVLAGVLAVLGGGVSALAAAPAGPCLGAFAFPDSTHFSEPRKHNEPGRSADPHREFKVAICLQLPFPRTPKKWLAELERRGGDALFRGYFLREQRFHAQQKQNRLPKKETTFLFWLPPPLSSLRLSPLRLLQDVKKCGSIGRVQAANRGRGAGERA